MIKHALIFIFTLSAYGEISVAAKETSRFQRVGPGDSVYSILRRLGFSDHERDAALSTKILPPSFVLAPGDLYRVVQNPQSKKIEVQFYDNSTPTGFSFWRQGRGESGSNKVQIQFTKNIATATGIINGSLVEAITRATGDELLAYRFMDAYVLDYNIPKSLQKGARFSLTYEKLFQGNTFIRSGEILKTELTLNGRREVREFKKLSVGGIFTGGKSHDDRPLYAPVNNIRVSSLYQPKRFHPIKKYRKAHLGIDFELPAGEPVYNVDYGRIVRFGRTRGAGNFVVIRHSNGLESYYNHLGSLSKTLRKGSLINAGAQIGTIGCTGYCTKPHLHFAIKKGGRFIDPVRLIRGYAFVQKNKSSNNVADTKEFF